MYAGLLLPPYTCCAAISTRRAKTGGGGGSVCVVRDAGALRRAVADASAAVVELDPAGAFELDEPLRIGRAVRLQSGAGGRATLRGGAKSGYVAISVMADGVALVGLGVVAGTDSSGDQQVAVDIHQAAARCVVSGCDLEGRVRVYGDGEVCDCVVHDVSYGPGINVDGERGKGTLTLRRTVVERCASHGVRAFGKAVVTVMEGVVVRECKGGDFYEDGGGTIVRQ